MGFRNCGGGVCVGHVAGFLSYIRHSDIVTSTTAKELGVLNLHLRRIESRVKDI